MQYGKFKETMYILQYTDQEGAGDVGPVKTYHYKNEEEAQRHRERLIQQRPDIHSIKIAKQTAVITREEV